MSLQMSRFTGSLLLLSLLSSPAAQAALDSRSEQQLQALQAQPERAGELIYRGTTYAQAQPHAAPLFRYERRVDAQADGLTASHLTRTPQGRLLIVEAAQATADYRLQRFTVLNRQAGFSGEVEVSADGRQLVYRLNDNGELSQAEETIEAPAVVGPSLHGFILAHWADLLAGERLPIRFVVLREKQTYGFNVRLKARADGQARFDITPSSLLIRWFIAPLEVVFDERQRRVLSYQGRVPPQQEIDGALHDLDAWVTYESIRSSYR